MKKILIISVAIILSMVCANAQTLDSLDTRPAVSVDSSFLGKDIFDVLPSKVKGDPAGVKIKQDASIRTALRRRVASNSFKEVSGYRVRIYFSNAQDARTASSAAAARFSERFPGYAVYRSYVNPNFKVTVGDFRTESEALRLREAVKGDFPAAFIVRENIKN